MQQPARQLLLRFAECLLMFGLVAAVGVFSKLFTRESIGVSTIWLANGLALGFLLYSARAHWSALLVACTLGQLASGALAGDPIRAVLLAAVFNTGEVLVAALPLRHGISNARELSRPASSLRFLICAVLLAPLLSTLALAGYLAVGGPTVSVRILEGWYIGHALGMATAAPVVLALRGNELGRLFRREYVVEVMLVLALVMAVTVGVFLQVRYPLLFLIFPPVMLAAMRGNFAGTAFVTIIVVVIAATFTSLGRGPLMLMSPAGPDSSTYLVLQFFIGVLLLTSFPVVVAMSNWRRNQRTERQLRNHLRLLADNSLDVIVLTDLEGRRLYVSPSVREVLGQQPEDFLRGTFRDLVSSTSREALQQQLGQLATKQRGKATITFPHRHADGRKLWLEARVRHFRDADLLQMNATTEPDSARDGDRREEGFVVTLRDISRRREAEQALEAANRKLSSLVWQDGLTGLGNRRQFDKALAESWEQCRLAGAPLSVILLDVDHFKRYNDHYGHLEGDLCLARVAKVIGESTRQEQDCAARYGGEEFALILPQTGARDATLAAERLRLGIRELALPHAGSPLDCVTVSLGMASCVPRTEDRPEDLVNAADKALYAGKAGGRNRVAIIDGLQSEPQLQERAD